MTCFTQNQRYWGYLIMKQPKVIFAGPKFRFRASLTLLVSLFICFGSGSYASETSITYATSDWVPVSFKNRDGNPDGLYVEILNSVFSRIPDTNFSVKFLPWKRAQVEVEKGHSDFLITVATKERLGYARRSTTPFFQMYMHVYTYSGHPKLDLIEKIKTVEDIAKLNLTAVTNLGNGWHKTEIENNGIKTSYVGSETPAVKFLAAKRADIMIDALVPTNHLIVTKGLTSKIKLTKARFGPLKMYILMSKKSSKRHLLTEIEKSYKAIQANGELEKITLKYSSFD